MRLFLCLLSLSFVFCSCRREAVHSYPPALQQTVDLFYVENQNDSVLTLLSSDDALDDRYSDLKNIFTAAALCEKGEVDSAAAVIARVKPSRKLHADFWYEHIKGLILFRENNYAEAYNTLFKAVNGTCRDTRAAALSERLIARILFTYGYNYDSVDWLIKSSSHFQQAGLEKSEGINEKILGRYYLSTGSTAEAFTSFQKSISMLKKHSDALELYYVYINLIDYYITTDKLDMAVQYADTCLQMLETWNDMQMKVLLYNNIGEIKLMQGKADEAAGYFKKTIETPPNYAASNIRLTNALIFLSKIYQEKGELRQALDYAERAKAVIETENHFLDSKFKIYSQLASIYAQIPVKKLQQNYRDTARMIQNDIESKQVEVGRNFYAVKYDLQKSVNEKEQIISKSRQQAVIALLALSVLMLLVVFLIMRYRSSRSRVRLLKELARKNLQLAEEERRKSAELHKLLHNAQDSNRKLIDNDMSVTIYDRITDWLQSGDNFKRKDLNVEMVAESLQSNREYISQAINSNGERFNDLVNRLRVNEAMKILSDSNHPVFNHKMSSIASFVGFHSLSVFYDAFKKQCGMTPGEFKAVNSKKVQ